LFTELNKSDVKTFGGKGELPLAEVAGQLGVSAPAIFKAIKSSKGFETAPREILWSYVSYHVVGTKTRTGYRYCD
jgi:hypothetical protein